MRSHLCPFFLALKMIKIRIITARQTVWLRLYHSTRLSKSISYLLVRALCYVLWFSYILSSVRLCVSTVSVNHNSETTDALRAWCVRISSVEL